jgi:hypothetical protein
MSSDHVAANPLPLAVIAAFPPSPDALLTTAASLITDSMLQEISQADYGRSTHAHLAQLRSIRDASLLPSPMEWEPREVLQLIRWSQPEDPTWKPGSTGERGHIMRAFSCATLLRAAPDPANEGEFRGENATLIQLIDSALYLGRGLPAAAASFLAWRAPLMPPDDTERPFFAFGLLALSLLVSPGALSPPDVDALVAFVEHTEALVRQNEYADVPATSNGSFLSLTSFDLRHSAWRALAAQLISRFSNADRLVALARRIEHG